MRAKNRKVLIPLISEVLLTKGVRAWYDIFEAAGVPAGPINGFAEVFDDPQIVHRQMRLDLPHATAGSVPQVANPVKFSATPVEYKRAPPILGEHTEEVLREKLGYDDERIAQLRAGKVI